jgi:hypothetical protein
MDTRKFGSGFIRPDDVRDGPRSEKISYVFEHDKFGCLVLEFESGDQFSLNQTNVRALHKAYGWESDNWIGHIVELSLGHYKDWKSDPPEEKETVVLRTISVQPSSSDSSGTRLPVQAPSPGHDMDDEIPF